VHRSFIALESCLTDAAIRSFKQIHDDDDDDDDDNEFMSVSQTLKRTRSMCIRISTCRPTPGGVFVDSTMSIMLAVVCFYVSRPCDN